MLRRPSAEAPRFRAAFVLVTALAGLAAPASGLETDQFLAWDRELADSTDAVNEFLNAGIEAVLEDVNRNRPGLACEKLPPRIFRYLFRDLTSSRIRHFVARHPGVDRYPGRDEAGYFKFLRMSVFRRPAFPFIMPMSRTIKLDGVHVGNDKFGHLFGFGRRYYRHYREALRKGLDEQAAMRETVLRGLRFERFFVGGWIDGIFSHADLEANFQGLLLARDLCEREHLRSGPSGWELRRPVDLRDYVNPNFDETYNPNHFVGPRRRQVLEIVEREYCDRYESQPVRALMARYRKMDHVSLSKELVDQHFRSLTRNPQLEQSLDRVCAIGPAGARTAALDGEEARRR